MIVAVHAAVGAALGKLVKRKDGAFAVGVASHLLCDLMPHKDFDIKVEAPLAAATLGVLALRCGVNSPEFIGALGAISPDAENAAGVVGLIPKESMRFPSHQGDHHHGPKVKSALPQGILAAACLLFIFWPRDKRAQG
jgi:hypothetical protein